MILKSCITIRLKLSKSKFKLMRINNQFGTNKLLLKIKVSSKTLYTITIMKKITSNFFLFTESIKIKNTKNNFRHLKCIKIFILQYSSLCQNQIYFHILTPKKCINQYFCPVQTNPEVVLFRLTLNNKLTNKNNLFFSA
jgi:hypothetical protein